MRIEVAKFSKARYDKLVKAGVKFQVQTYTGTIVDILSTDYKINGESYICGVKQFTVDGKEYGISAILADRKTGKTVNGGKGNDLYIAWGDIYEKGTILIQRMRGMTRFTVFGTPSGTNRFTCPFYIDTWNQWCSDTINEIRENDWDYKIPTEEEMQLFHELLEKKGLHWDKDEQKIYRHAHIIDPGDKYYSIDFEDGHAVVKSHTNDSKEKLKIPSTQYYVIEERCKYKVGRINKAINE